MQIADGGMPVKAGATQSVVGLRPSLDRHPTIGTEASIEVKAKTKAVFRYPPRNPVKNQKKNHGWSDLE